MSRREKDYWLEHNGRGHSISQHETNQAVAGNIWNTNLPMWLLHIKSHNSSSTLCSRTVAHKCPSQSFELAITLKNATGLPGWEGRSFSTSSHWPIQEQILTNGVSVNCASNFYIAQSREKAKMWSLPIQHQKRWAKRYITRRPLLAGTLKVTAFTHGRITFSERMQN